MITRQSASVAEAMFNATSSLNDGSDECVLYREDLVALVEHIADLEFEVSRLKGTAHITHPVAVLYQAFNRRAE